MEDKSTGSHDDDGDDDGWIF